MLRYCMICVFLHLRKRGNRNVFVCKNVPLLKMFTFPCKFVFSIELRNKTMIIIVLWSSCLVSLFVNGLPCFSLFFSYRLMNTENNLIHTREEMGVAFERALVASEFMDWLLQEGEVPTREEAEQLGRRLLEHGIIQHVTNKHHFVDGPLLYQFRMNFRRRRRLIELLHERSRGIPESHDSPFCLRKQQSDGGNTSFLSVSPTKEIKVAVGVRRSSMSSSCGSSGYYSSSPTLSSSPPVLCNPKSVVKRQVTPEELLTPGGPFIKKTFTIVGDAVGWGFVVRGSKPCHIQAVDPGGPAAAVGMKVYLLACSSFTSPEWFSDV
ncbi:hypothetical protein ATANTOWER_005128 [Ataeniobius toweri]|uniref:DEP domain-containing protein n=1 Tax=Ataeniobius toweri TaxID=208326 RepID=A0ABU7C6N3_9TELE|nr:hypothetical protein [Ataeniobius toweri]